MFEAKFGDDPLNVTVIIITIYHLRLNKALANLLTGLICSRNSKRFTLLQKSHLTLESENIEMIYIL